jgi:heptosyltransferase-3
MHAHEDVPVAAAAAPRRLLLLQCRNYGDAVIGTGLVEALGRSGCGTELHLLTRPRFAALYRNNPLVSEVHLAEFPMGTAKSFGPGAALHLARQVARLRRRGYDRVVSLCGDFREIGLGWSIAPRGNCSLLLPLDHPRRRLERAGLAGLVSVPVPVPPEELNVYAMVQRVATALGATAPARQQLYDAACRLYRHCPDTVPLIGLHPSAGVPSKQWPTQRWRALLALIRAQGWRTLIFGAPAERARLEADFAGLLAADVELATGEVDEFFARLGSLSAFVGLDSFGVHAAHAVGTPVVLLNGPILSGLIAPPGALLVDGGAGLPCHPCYNRPICLDRPKPYQCMGELPESRVLAGLRRLLDAGDSPAAAKL